MQLSLADESPEYREFVEKFKPKKTTDDCYTPPEIYEAILAYVVERYGIDEKRVIRPFWPGADYMRLEYPDGCTVVDNPPFSIISEIVAYYLGRGVPFFVFAPGLTCLASRKTVMRCNHIVCDATITYANGAQVKTGFITNLDDGIVLEASPELGDIINAVDDELRHRDAVRLPRYEYPDHVITAAKAQWFAAHHTPFVVRAEDCTPIGSLDAMGDKGIFGGGLLLSERAAAELAAAERAAAERAAAERAAAERAAAERAAAKKWRLSEREMAVVRMLSENGRRNDG